MFTRKIKIHLRDTDATGVLYFTEQLRMALETLEECFSLKQMLEKENFLMPIVHAEADYFQPLFVGDEVEIALSVARMGETSLTFSYRFFDPVRNLEVGKVSIVHVAVSKESRLPILIPRELLQMLPAGFESSSLR